MICVSPFKRILHKIVEIYPKKWHSLSLNQLILIEDLWADFYLAFSINIGVMMH
jgi:hypothetical protein